MTGRRDDVVAQLLRGLRARLRADRMAEGLLAGAVVCFVALTLGLLSIGHARHVVAHRVAAARPYDNALVDSASPHSWSLVAVAVEAETRVPALRNHLVTALELDAHPDRATPAIRDHVTRYLTRVVGGLAMDEVHSRRRSHGYLAAAGITAIVTTGAWLVLSAPSIRQAIGAAISTGESVATGSGIARLRLSIAPPAYVRGTPARSPILRVSRR